jgi:hypothetical protein
MAQQQSNPTEQGKVGYKKPPVDKQFGKPTGNPRHNGSWKKEDTPRFKLEQMMKLSADDLRKVAEDKSAPLFEQKLAIAIKNGQWREIREMIEQVYGKPKESVDVTTQGESINPYAALTTEELRKLAGK